MDVMRAIETRRSIRRFKTEPVPRQAIEQLLDLATKAPSAKNAQPWSFVVLEGQKKNEVARMLSKGAAELKVQGLPIGSAAQTADVGGFLGQDRPAATWGRVEGRGPDGRHDLGQHAGGWFGGLGAGGPAGRIGRAGCRASPVAPQPLVGSSHHKGGKAGRVGERPPVKGLAADRGSPPPIPTGASGPVWGPGLGGGADAGAPPASSPRGAARSQSRSKTALSSPERSFDRTAKDRSSSRQRAWWLQL